MMQAESAAAIKTAAENSGGEYFFVTVPCQYAFFEDKYPTDNHFGIECAYIVYDMIMDSIDATGEVSIPRTERTTTILENHYLGSRARKARCVLAKWWGKIGRK